MSKPKKPNSGRTSPKSQPKTGPIKPSRRRSGKPYSGSTGGGSDSKKGYKPIESTHQTNPPNEGGSGVKGS